MENGDELLICLMGNQTEKKIFLSREMRQKDKQNHKNIFRQRETCTCQVQLNEDYDNGSHRVKMLMVHMYLFLKLFFLFFSNNDNRYDLFCLRKNNLGKVQMCNASYN